MSSDEPPRNQAAYDVVKNCLVMDHAFPLETAIAAVQAHQELIDDACERNVNLLVTAEEIVELCKPRPTFELLHGNSVETAYLVNDYPFGSHIRCVMRHWIETCHKGAQRDKQRFMSQTTRKDFNKIYTGLTPEEREARALVAAKDERQWNAAKGSVYASQMFMYIDHADRSHVKNLHLNYHSNPAVFYQVMEYFGAPDDPACQMNGEEKRRYKDTEYNARRFAPSAWKDFLTAQNAPPINTVREESPDA